MELSARRHEVSGARRGRRLNWLRASTSGAGLSMTEQVPEDLTEAEVAERRKADRFEDEGVRPRLDGKWTVCAQCSG